MKMNELFLKKIIESISKHFLLRMFFFFILVNIVWLIRFPFIYKKIYAEDGKLFLNEAFEFTFPLDLLQPAAGYSQLIQRIGGRVVSLFPLEFSPLVCGLFSALAMSFFAAGVFKYNNFAGDDLWPSFVLSLSLIFLPITSYSVVGNVANLYVFPTVAAAVLLYHNDSSKKEVTYKSFVFILATLSLPLSVFLLPIMVHRAYLEKKITRKWKIQQSDIAFLVGIFLQFFFILATSLGERVPHSPNSALKTIYLYLDRGIGISTIPKWGFVSGSSGNILYDGTIWFLRNQTTRLLAIILVIIILFLVYRKGHSVISSHIKSQIGTIMLLGFFYSLLVGLFFNPEPRYMVLTSFLTIWAILLLFDAQAKKRLGVASYLYIVLVLILGLTASSHRSQGPDWKKELKNASLVCLQDKTLKNVKIRTLPMDALWEMTIPCNVLK